MKKCVFLTAACISAICLHSKVVTFEYDKSGNRTKRYVATVQNAPKRIDTASIDESSMYATKDKVYPNPVESDLHFELDESAVGGCIAVYSSSLQLLSTYRIDFEKGSIDFSSHPAGPYFVCIITDGNMRVHKIIKK